MSLAGRDNVFLFSGYGPRSRAAMKTFLSCYAQLHEESNAIIVVFNYYFPMHTLPVAYFAFSSEPIKTSEYLESVRRPKPKVCIRAKYAAGKVCTHLRCIECPDAYFALMHTLPFTIFGASLEIFYPTTNTPHFHYF